MSWFDIFIIVVVIASLVKGYMSGFVMQIASLAGIIIGAVFAGQLSYLIQPKLLELTDGNTHFITALSYVIAFLIIFIALFLVGRLINNLVKAIKLNFINRIAGSVFCVAKWMFVFSIALNILIEFDQEKKIIKEDIRKKTYTYPLVKDLAPKAIPYLRF